MVCRPLVTGSMPPVVGTKAIWVSPLVPSWTKMPEPQGRNREIVFFLVPGQRSRGAGGGVGEPEVGVGGAPIAFGRIGTRPGDPLAVGGPAGFALRAFGWPDDFGWFASGLVEIESLVGETQIGVRERRVDDGELGFGRMPVEAVFAVFGNGQRLALLARFDVENVQAIATHAEIAVAVEPVPRIFGFDGGLAEVFLGAFLLVRFFVSVEGFAEEEGDGLSVGGPLDGRDAAFGDLRDRSGFAAFGGDQVNLRAGSASFGDERDLLSVG